VRDLSRAMHRLDAAAPDCASALAPKALARLGARAVDSALIKAGLRAGSWAAACMVTPEGIPGLPSPDAQWCGHRDRRLAGRANRYTGAPAMAALATGSRSVHPASDQSDGSAAATLTLPGRCRRGAVRRHCPHAAHPHAVVKPLRSTSLLSSPGGDGPIIIRPLPARTTASVPVSQISRGRSPRGRSGRARLDSRARRGGGRARGRHLRRAPHHRRSERAAWAAGTDVRELSAPYASPSRVLLEPALAGGVGAGSR
jgi:hypothetical protein